MLRNGLTLDPASIAVALKGAFAQPAEQRLPPDFLAMVIQLDRSKALCAAVTSGPDCTL